MTHDDHYLLDHVPSLEAQIAGTCVHFNGHRNEACKAGVSYRRLAGGRSGRAALDGLPCLSASIQFWRKRFGAPLAVMRSCERHELPSAEAVASELAEHERVFECKRRGVSPCCDAAEDHSYPGTARCSSCRAQLYRYIPRDER